MVIGVPWEAELTAFFKTVGCFEFVEVSNFRVSEFWVFLIFGLRNRPRNRARRHHTWILVDRMHSPGLTTTHTAMRNTMHIYIGSTIAMVAQDVVCLPADSLQRLASRNSTFICYHILPLIQHTVSGCSNFRVFEVGNFRILEFSNFRIWAFSKI